MREILFRGKRVDNGKWVYGYYLYSEKYNKHYIVDERITTTLEGKLVPQESGFIKKEVIPETVGQHTGLTDKNGKRIFEGDIVKGKYCYESDNTLDSKMEEVDFIAKIVFEEGAFMVECIDGHIHKSSTRAMFTLEYFRIKVEIIGDIFDKEYNDENFN